MTVEDIEDRVIHAIAGSHWVVNVDAFSETGDPALEGKHGCVVVTDDGSEFRISIVRTESERA